MKHIYVVYTNDGNSYSIFCHNVLGSENGFIHISTEDAQLCYGSSLEFTFLSYVKFTDGNVFEKLPQALTHVANRLSEQMLEYRELVKRIQTEKVKISKIWVTAMNEQNAESKSCSNYTQTAPNAV